MGRKIKINSTTNEDGAQCPMCSHFYKRVDKHLKQAHKRTWKESKTLFKNQLDPDSKFYKDFEDQYLKHRISGKSVSQDHSHGRDIINLKNIVGYMRRSLGGSTTIPQLLREAKAIKKLGDGGNGYIDQKVFRI